MFPEFEKASILVEVKNIVYSPNSTPRPSFKTQRAMEEARRIQQAHEKMKEMEKSFALDEEQRKMSQEQLDKLIDV